MSEQKHSSLPWTTQEREGHSPMGSRPVIVPANGECDRIAIISYGGVHSEDEADANKDFIVLACNSYYKLRALNAKLVEVLEWIVAQEDYTFAECTLAEEIMDKCRAVLAEAKETEHETN